MRVCGSNRNSSKASDVHEFFDKRRAQKQNGRDDNIWIPVIGEFMTDSNPKPGLTTATYVTVFRTTGTCSAGVLLKLLLQGLQRERTELLQANEGRVLLGG